jgi:threonine dehydratase
VGVEPEGAPSMTKALQKGRVITLNNIDSFIDGAAVKRVGDITFDICKDNFHEVVTVPEGLVCSKMLKLYTNDAIVAEPAGALSLAALPLYEKAIQGKNVVCIVSGSNNDISRLEEIKERALLYEGLKHYFIIRFPQRAGALRQFVVDILGPDDDITHFEYFKKHNREQGPAVVGVELKNKEDFRPLLDRIRQNGFMGEYLNEKSDLFQFLVG